MGVVRIAVGTAVAALLAGHALATLDPARRQAFWAEARSLAAGRQDAPVAGDSRRTPVDALTTSAHLGREIVLPDRSGQFQTLVDIDGQRLPVLVDTGASEVALRYEDAARLGLRLRPADFDVTVGTANGTSTAARVMLRSVRLGGIEVRDVSALVIGPGRLDRTLLGMSFMSRLSAVSVDHGRLVLTR